MRRRLLLLLVAACLLAPPVVVAQGLTGALMGTVKDEQGGALPGARVSLSSPALIGGPTIAVTDETGHLRFPVLPPGLYALDIALQGFAAYHEVDLPIATGVTLERNPVLKVGGVSESVFVEGVGSRLDARNPGFASRFGPEDLHAIPSRRSSMFDFIRAAPGISPTSPSSGTTTTFSAFGSGSNENLFLIDNTNMTCPCNGIARAEVGVDFIQEVQVHSVGASAEFGNMQGAVVNVLTRSGSNRFLYDASYYGQPARLTSQPVRLPYDASGQLQSGYERNRYRDATTNLGGPVVRDRLWFFSGYQYLRDYDSQPGSDPARPKISEQNKVFAKLTWRLAPGWQMDQYLHEERWASTDRPTRATPWEATTRQHASVPSVTFAHVTHTSASNTVWDVRVGRFVYTRSDDPSTGNRTTPNRSDTGTGISSGGPSQFGGLTLKRTNAKAMFIHYWPGRLGGDHELKAGGQIERGEHETPSVIASGVRFVDINGLPSQSISSAPSNTGGVSISSSAFISDAVRLGNRLTISAGVRFDHSRAISQNLHAVDLEGQQTPEIVRGLGTMYTWNVLSPRLGVAVKLSDDGRTILRGSYGRYSQGVLTGELGIFHPGATPITTTDYDPATGGYTGRVSVVDTKNLQFDPHMRAPHTDESSLGVDREIGHQLSVSMAYVRKDGANFIGWTDVGGQYREETQTLKDDRTVTVFRLVSARSDRLYLLTNQPEYAMTYNGLVLAAEKRQSHGWQAFGSYTLSRTSGLLPSSGATAAGAQVSTIAPPPAPFGLTFGRDPNDLINARGRLPVDRPHMFRVMGTVELPRTGFTVAANLQYATGKPWAATAQVNLPQNPQQRIQLEPRGSRRLSSQTLLDLRLSRAIPFGKAGRVELLVDVLNVLNDAAEEGLVTDNFFSANFGKPSVFMDPRRVMFSVRFNLGR